MPKGTEGPAVTQEPKQPKLRKAATTARAARAGYKQQAATLAAENDRLKAKIARLEAAGSTHESSLILRTATDSFKHGVETGLMLQGVK